LNDNLHLCCLVKARRQNHKNLQNSQHAELAAKPLKITKDRTLNPTITALEEASIQQSTLNNISKALRFKK